MGRHPTRDAAAARCAGDAAERVEHLRHRARIVARRDEIAQPQVVCLSLIVPSVFQKQQPQTGLRQRAVLVHLLRGQDRSDTEAELKQLLLGHLAHAVPPGDVTDLVTDHRYQFGLVVHVRHDPARDVDVAAGQRKGVDDRIVDDAEGPLEVRSFRARCNLGAELLHVLLELVVVVQTELGRDRLVVLSADLELLRLGNQRELALARGRVDHAASQQGDRDSNAGPKENSVGSVCAS